MFVDRAVDAVPPATPRPHYERRADRIAFDMLVRYAWRGRRATAMLKDLTRFGARIEGLEGLRKGDALTLLLPGLQAIDADVAWSDGRSAGLSLPTAIPAGAFRDLVSNFASGRAASDPILPLRKARAA
ncbi:MAG TPA: hypothetical protein VI199_08900 [Novosphingobium sp.]